MKRDPIVRAAGIKQTTLAAFVAFSFAMICASGIAGLGDTDPYRHLAYAHQLWASHFTLRGHPFLPLTVLGSTGTDLWWGFHLFLVPFTILGNVWGARVAGGLIAALVAGTIAWLLHRSGQRRAALFALAPLAISSIFAFRDHLARPAHLTIVLLLVDLFAGAGELPVAAAFVASLLHATMHMSSPLSPLVTAIGSLGRRLPKSSSKIRPSDSIRPVLWSVGGLGVGLLIRPDRSTYLATAFQISVTALGGASGGRIPHAAPELFPIDARILLGQTIVSAVLLTSAWAIGKSKSRCGTPALRTAVAIACFASLLLCFRASRFLDYLIPLIAVFAGLLWPREPLSRIPQVVASALIFGGMILGAQNATAAWPVGNRYIDPPQTFDQMADAVRAHVPNGELIFTDDPFITGVLYSYLPEYKYVVAYDPALLFSADPKLFWRWHNVVVYAVDCDNESCPGLSPSPGQIVDALKSMKANWIITSYPRDTFSMQSVMAQSPGDFTFVAGANGPVTGLYLWKVGTGR